MNTGIIKIIPFTFKNIDYWFKSNVITELTIIKNNINKISYANLEIQELVKDFCNVAYSEIIRYVSNTRNNEFKLYRMNQAKLEKT